MEKSQAAFGPTSLLAARPEFIAPVPSYPPLYLRVNSFGFLNFFLFCVEDDFILDKKKAWALKWGCLEKEKGLVLKNFGKEGWGKL
jgi:hypothetical protein